MLKAAARVVHEPPAPAIAAASKLPPLPLSPLACIAHLLEAVGKGVGIVVDALPQRHGIAWPVANGDVRQNLLRRRVRHAGDEHHGVGIRIAAKVGIRMIVELPTVNIRVEAERVE